MSNLGFFGDKVVKCRVGCRDLSCKALGRSRGKGGCPTLTDERMSCASNTA